MQKESRLTKEKKNEKDQEEEVEKKRTKKLNDGEISRI